MKSVYSTQEQITHLWANATQPHARCANASYSTSTMDDGTILSTLLSYSSPIAYRVQSTDSSAPPMFVISRAPGWSITTQKHIRAAFSAVPHVYCDTTVFTTPFPSGGFTAYPWTSNQTRGATLHNMRELMVMATAARSQRVMSDYTEAALRLGTDFNDMLAWVTARTPQWALATPALIDIDIVMGADYKVVLAQQRADKKALDAARAAQLAQLRAEWAHTIVAWRDHVTLPGIGHAITTLADDTPLRISKDSTRVETMRSAEIPLAHAQQLWRVLQWDTLVKVTLALKRSKLGNYTIDQVKPNRDLVVGCHIITFTEMQLLAAKHPDLFPSTTTTESE